MSQRKAIIEWAYSSQEVETETFGPKWQQLTPEQFNLVGLETRPGKWSDVEELEHLRQGVDDYIAQHS